MLLASDIRVDLGGTTILDRVWLTVAPGEVLAILGPNGAGKSTLLKVLSGSLPVRYGAVAMAEKRLTDWRPQSLARQRAVLPQQSELTFPFRVLDVVLLGRSPHAGYANRAEDLAVAEAALGETEAGHLADRIYTTLSGGEQQRVHLARTLAQIWPSEDRDDGAERYLLLDEPTSSLDLAHQHSTLETARRFAARGVGVVAILHDLNLAAMHADRLCLIKAGRIVAEGPPEKTLRTETVEDVFDLRVRVTSHPTRNCPYVIPA